MATVSFRHLGNLAFSAAVVLRDGRTIALEEREFGPRGEASVWVFEAEGFALEMACTVIAPETYRLDPVVRATPELLGQVDQVVVFEAAFPNGHGNFGRYYSARREIWLPVGLRQADNTPLPDGPPERGRGVLGETTRDYWADNLIALYSPGGDAFLAGVRLPARHGLEMTYGQRRLRIAHRVEHVGEATDCIVPDSFVLKYDAPLVESLIWYGRLNHVTASRPDHRAAMTAWNSWDYYEAHITQGDMIACAKAIAADAALKARIQAIVLDDGWAGRNGDWLPNPEKFPDLAGMAAEIRGLGFVPGIWYSPFRVDPKCEWAAKHPETVLWGPGRGFYPKALTREAKAWVLDPTHPLVVQKVFEDLSRLKAMGFGYFKTDFIQAVNSNFMRAEFFDKRQSPVEAVRRVMQAIRAAIGHDAFWLACGTEFLPVAGLPDASRISDDITERFSTLQVAVRHCAMYFWANGNLWVTDPDFLVVRGTDTSSSPHLHRCSELGSPRAYKPYERAILNTGEFFTLEEARTWANFHIVYGGTLAWSDHPGQLNARGRELLDKVLEWHESSGPGVPIDLEERNLPRKWLRPTRGGWLLGVFNFDDEAQAIHIAPTELARHIGPLASYTDIWTGERWPTNDHRMADPILLPAHQSRVYFLELE